MRHAAVAKVFGLQHAHAFRYDSSASFLDLRLREEEQPAVS
jgi:hypothetical protein